MIRIRPQTCLALLAVLLCAFSPATAAAMSWGAPRAIDTAGPFTSPVPIGSLACPASGLCVAGDAAGFVLSSTHPGGGRSAWTRTRAADRAITGMSCPDKSLCVGVDVVGEAIVNTAPGAGGSWTRVHLSRRPLTAISCPSSGFCAAVDDGGSVWTTTAPAGGAAGWSSRTIDPAGGLDGIACPSTSFCAAVDPSGYVITSTDPADSAPTWSRARIDRSPLDSIACPTESLCLAGDDQGSVLSATEPSAGASAWTTQSGIGVGTQPALVALACAGPGFCLGATAGGSVVSSTDPVSAAGGWTIDPIGRRLQALACPSTAFCLGGGAEGILEHSSDPGSDPGGWQSVAVDGISPLRSVACRGDGLCLAGDDGGRILAGRGGGGWQRSGSGAGGAIYGLACPSARSCLGLVTRGDVPGAANQGGGSVRRFDPLHPGARWAGVDIGMRDGADGVDALACPSAQLCVARDDAGHGYRTVSPPVPGWGGLPPRQSALSAVASGGSCATPTLCLAPGPRGTIRLLTPDGRGGIATRTVTIDPGLRILAVACAGARFCAAIDGAGNALGTVTPSGGAGGWSRRHVDDFALTALSCASPRLCVAVDDQGAVVVGR